ncbi:FAD dependent oxidoreductase TIGR03364 [Arthrobacter subterraneus]|uniref:FAD dependent oxidoreductase TIGR03364 n=1 Tax=Arthrobacter subterraneus TaxID=335973 RepID=A0A1G8INU7_9MICC|nr:TIGR03364 family FAD-dependent oxidoreductase [Arthrobacter subterraneus]SDI20471.1 FAD dependent oxidoreductase TIGR03364 [Arthrobacter subterraneus]
MNLESFPDRPADVVIVGAGILGLAHAALAADRGLSVTVIERDERAVGASIRNFGHCCVTAQSGELYGLAQAARRHWLDYAQRAGFWAAESGALVVARSGIELQVLKELASAREAGQVTLLDAHQVTSRLRSTHGTPDPDIQGGALLRDDLRVDPRTTVAALAAWLQQQGVRFLWKTSALSFDDGVVHTSRGPVYGGRTIVCVGHDVDYLFPAAAAEHVIRRCTLQMSRAARPAGLDLEPAVLTATSMLRYDAFTDMPSSDALRASVDQDLLDIGANVMFTQRPDGTLILGDSHAYQHTAAPFLAERTTHTLNVEISGILGTPLEVVERWQGIYASSPNGALFVKEVAPGVTAVSVTSGVGMTVSFGLAERTLDTLFPAG